MKKSMHTYTYIETTLRETTKKCIYIISNTFLEL